MMKKIPKRTETKKGTIPQQLLRILSKLFRNDTAKDSNKKKFPNRKLYNKVTKEKTTARTYQDNVEKWSDGKEFIENY